MTEAWLHLQAFFDILFTRNVLIEAGALVVCVGIGWLAAILLRGHERFRALPRPGGALGMDLLAYIAVIVLPALVVFGLVLLARGIVQAVHLDVTILDAVLRLIGAYVVIRVGVLLFALSLGNKVLDAESGEPGDAAHLARVRRRLSWLARSDRCGARRDRHHLGKEPHHGLVGVESCSSP